MKWIDAKIRQPETGMWDRGKWGTYIVCIAIPDAKRVVIPATWNGKWMNDGGFELKTVIAWCEMPEALTDEELKEMEALR
jgi:hypothetical protein